jgi:hypothetical protein
MGGFLCVFTYPVVGHLKIKIENETYLSQFVSQVLLKEQKEPA